MGWDGVTVYTVGHSTRSLDELVELLGGFQVKIVGDVRTIPRSRHNPEFNADVLPGALAKHGVGYRQLARLGGLRRTSKESPNLGWRNASFRGFADYMSTAEFELGMRELGDLLGQGTVALMCAEAVPWRCHRSLIADALLVRGARVEHIVGRGRASEHRLTPFAQVDGLRITYPARPP
jgi:uncharacterized protein (DUF488 family)